MKKMTNAGDMAEIKPDPSIITPLLAWYDENKRILPWREDKDPYKIWVSEIMLQQTRVAAVMPYYERFLRALPDVGSLAAAEEEKLLKLWEGLGYYNRVRNMQKAARTVMEEHGGQFPPSYDLLLRLPGIGEYTAGAVASIAFGKCAPAVDGNVLRILTRLTADRSDVLDAKTKKKYAEYLARVLPKDRPGDVNQAMMELGATVCIPNGQPKCGSCPWQDRCLAHQQDLTDEIPHKKKKNARKIEKKTVLLIRDDKYTLIRKRPEGGLLGGMYEYPMLEGWVSSTQAKSFAAELGFVPLSIKKTDSDIFIFTHKEWHMQGYLVKVADTMPEAGDESKGPVLPEGYRLILPGQIDKDYALPSALKAFREML